MERSYSRKRSGPRPGCQSCGIARLSNLVSSTATRKSSPTMLSSARVRDVPFQGPPSAGKRVLGRPSAKAAALPEFNVTKRDLLLSGAVLASPLVLGKRVAAEELAPGRTKLSVKNLNSFQRNAERAAFLAIVESELKKELKSSDAPDTLRLVLHDAGTYDVATGTGGLNGSIVLDEELNRPENESLKPIVSRLKKVKAEIEQKTVKAGYGPISWADLEVTAAKVANESDWRAVKKARGLPSSGDVISSAFGASWPLKLGRQDTDKPDPPGRLPPPNASVPEITDFFARLNNRNYGATGFFAPRPIFDERQAFILYGSSQPDVAAAEAKLAAEPNTKYKNFKNKYEQSRQTVTRTDYEVDLIDYFNQLVSLGAKFNTDAYLVPIEIDTPRF